MALNGTMVKIDTVTVGSGGAASIDFTNIPQTFTDLKIVFSLRSNRVSTVDNINLRFNGTTTNYSSRRLQGTGSVAESQTYASNIYAVTNAANNTASTFGNGTIYVPNYTASQNKSVSIDTVTEDNATAAFTNLVAGLWSNTAAITSVALNVLDGTLWNQHSTATLYGISRTTAQIKATGGMVYDDADYVYHLFASSGTFTPTSNLTCDVLVVAGGGGGGIRTSRGGGGGGAGGVIAHNSQALTATNYTVTIGGGGAGKSTTVAVGTAGDNGSSSQFGSLTSATGGGGGGGFAGQNGGSGGGGVNGDLGGTGTSGQGNAGGTGSSTTTAHGGGGGGGAGAVGANGSSTVGGNGGNGSTSYSSWLLATNTGQNVSGTYYIAGGGGGGAGAPSAPTGTAGTGGFGGGANGSNVSTASSNAIVNTGSGGGGGGGTSSTVQASSNGGSGVVIVRYAK
jgi:hypothetical protein